MKSVSEVRRPTLDSGTVWSEGGELASRRAGIIVQLRHVRSHKFITVEPGQAARVPACAPLLCEASAADVYL